MNGVTGVNEFVRAAMQTTGRVQRWSTAARLVLLAAVLAGLFGMHVLDADHDTARHGATGAITAHEAMTAEVATHAGGSMSADSAGPVVGVTTRPAAAGSELLATGSDHGSGGDHAAMAGCVLFLVIGGAALMLALLRRRRLLGLTDAVRFARSGPADRRRRGPPVRWPREALCVIRV